MIAKIGKGSNMYGAILYNQQKVEKENGTVLLLNKIPDTVDGRYSVAYFNKCFEPYLSVNIKTEKTVRHISLNPDPSDKVSDEQFTEMAQEYMERMGYGNQPYIVFKHTDIDRTHIHIVSTCVGIDGKKIPDDYDHSRSMAICRDLEQKYNMQKATEQEQKQANKVFKPVNHKDGDIKSQIASIVRHLPKYYSYSTMGSYNALLSLFNITAEEVKGERNGQPVNGLVYVALDENGNKASNPFKASLFFNPKTTYIISKPIPSRASNTLKSNGSPLFSNLTQLCSFISTTSAAAFCVSPLRLRSDFKRFPRSNEIKLRSIVFPIENYHI